MNFIYDGSGRPFALNYSTVGGNRFTTYYYVLNLQGDVVKLIDQDGAEAASYEYDAWGGVLSVDGDMAGINPLRYRGYYYDSETGFYYLQSRYYDPTNHRFINADSYASTGQGFVGTNMFAYCNNLPIILSDSTGAIPTFSTMLMDGGTHGSGEYDERVNGVGRAPRVPANSDTVIYSREILEYNCLSYALQTKSLVILDGYVPGDSVNRVARLTMDKVQSMGIGIRPIVNCNSPIRDNEYRIALRVGASDYHFMIQNSDGYWSQKPGALPPTKTGIRNPTNAAWNAFRTQEIRDENDQIVWFNIKKQIINYYDSETRYFAVSLGG